MNDRRITALARDRWAGLLVFAVWGWICLPKIIQTISAPKYRSAIGVDNVKYSKIAGLADYAFYYGIIALCGLIILVFINEIPRSGGLRLLALLAPWAYLVVRDLYVPLALSDTGIIFGLVGVTMWILRPHFRVLSVLGYLTGLTTLISLAIGVAMPSHAIYQSITGELITQDKQIFPIGILVGIFTQGNNLGQFIVLGLPAAFLIRNRWHRTVLVMAIAAALVWSASRGSLVAAGVGLLTVLLLRVSRGSLRTLVAWALPTSAFLIAGLVPLLTTSGTAFANRGLIWVLSLRSWESNQWFGFGADWYHQVGDSSDRIAGSVFHGHNQLVHFLVTGGLVLVLLTVPQLWLVIRRSAWMAAGGQFFGTVWFTMLASTCLFEKAFVFVDNPNFLVTILLPFTFVLFANKTGAPERIDHVDAFEAEISEVPEESDGAADPVLRSEEPGQVVRS